MNARQETCLKTAEHVEHRLAGISGTLYEKPSEYRRGDFDPEAEPTGGDQSDVSSSSASA